MRTRGRAKMGVQNEYRCESEMSGEKNGRRHRSSMTLRGGRFLKKKKGEGARKKRKWVGGGAHSDTKTPTSMSMSPSTPSAQCPPLPTTTLPVPVHFRQASRLFCSCALPSSPFDIRRSCQSFFPSLSLPPSPSCEKRWGFCGELFVALCAECPDVQERLTNGEWSHHTCLAFQFGKVPKVGTCSGISTEGKIRSAHSTMARGR